MTGLAEAPRRPRLLCTTGNSAAASRANTKSVSQPNKTEPVPPEPSPDCERRRIGKVVHDERGNASVRWLDAPADYQRPVLEVAPDSAPVRGPVESFNPYAREVAREAPACTRSAGNTARTDLRKLSEWIKLTRELEERKRNGGDRD